MESTLYLMKNVDLDPDYNYTIDFDSKLAQDYYFSNKISLALESNDGYSYIKENEVIKVYQNIDELFGVNYLCYTNNNKKYYAFILNKKWAGDECTAIEFKIDVMQSFMFDYELKECFVEREHQDRYRKSNDNTLTPIYSRTSEQLERGNQYYCKNIENIEENLPQIIKDDFSEMLASNQFNIHWVYIVSHEPLVSELYNQAGTSMEGVLDNPTAIRGVPTNTYGYVVPLVTTSGMSGGSSVKSFGIELKSGAVRHYGTLNLQFLKSLCENPKVISINISRYSPFNYNIEKVTDTINGLKVDTYYFIPSIDNEMFNGVYLGKHIIGDGYCGLFTFAHFRKDIFKTLKIKSHDFNLLLYQLSIDNPKDINLEPKLLTSDYKYYKLSYGNQDVQLNIEDFNSINDAEIKILSSFSVMNGQAIIPLNYKGMTEAYTDMMTFDSITNELPLRTDAWRTYLSQHKNSMITGFATNAIQGATQGAITGATMGGAYGAIIGGVLGVANGVAQQVAQIKDIKATPDKVNKTTIDTTLDHAIDDLFIKCNVFEIHDQWKNKIFNYFYHYGYKCNEHLVPNTRSRYYFNYIKTIGANIKTNIDADYKAKIMQIYDNGITIWHYRSPHTFKGVNNYEYENVEMNFMEE